MGNLSKILNEKLEATDALVFYKSNLNEGAYVEHRPIRNGAMCAGKPLEVDVIAKLLKTVDKYAHGTTSMVSLHGELGPTTFGAFRPSTPLALFVLGSHSLL